MLLKATGRKWEIYELKKGNNVTFFGCLYGNIVLKSIERKIWSRPDINDQLNSVQFETKSVKLYLNNYITLLRMCIRVRSKCILSKKHLANKLYPTTNIVLMNISHLQKDSLRQPKDVS